MRIYLKTIILVFYTLIFSSCLVQSGIQEAVFLNSQDECGFAVNQYTGQGLRWNKSKLPVVFYIHESVPPSAHKNFISAINHWNMAWREYLERKGLQFFPLFTVKDREMQYSGSPEKDGYNMLFFVHKDFSNYERTTIQAFTKMNYNRQGNIEDTDIIINGEHFKYFYDYNYDSEILTYENKNLSHRNLAQSHSPSLWLKIKKTLQNWTYFFIKIFKKIQTERFIASPHVQVPRDRVDFPSLMIHELGHVPGMAHFEANKHSNHRTVSRKTRSSIAQQSFTSVMEPLLASGRSRRAIKNYDLNNLFCGYINY